MININAADSTHSLQKALMIDLPTIQKCLQHIYNNNRILKYSPHYSLKEGAI